MQRLLLALPTILPSGAFAHELAGDDPASLVAGLSHPILGPVDLVAMLAIGVLAAMSGGAARWAYPASAIGGMIVGGGVIQALGPIGPAGLASTALLGASVIAFPWRVSVGGACAALGLFGAVHGYIHGFAGLASDGLRYALGFLLTASSLVGIGFLLGIAIGHPHRPAIVKALGALVCLAGFALAVG